MKRSYNVQYALQKKQKIWQDGTLVVRDDSRHATLLNDAGKTIDSVVLPSSFVIEPDAECDGERYLIRVDDTVANQTKTESPVVKEEPLLRRAVPVRLNNGFKTPFRNPNGQKLNATEPVKLKTDPTFIVSDRPKMPTVRPIKQPAFSDGEDRNHRPFKKPRPYRNEKDVLLGISHDEEKLGLFWLHELMATIDYDNVHNNNVSGSNDRMEQPLHQAATVKSKSKSGTSQFVCPVQRCSNGGANETSFSSMRGARIVRYPPLKKNESTSSISSSSSSSSSDAREGEPQIGRRVVFKPRTDATSAVSAGAFKDIRLPLSISEVRSIQAKPAPNIPDFFDSVSEYQHVLTSALVHQLQLQLAEISERICEYMAKNCRAQTLSTQKLGRCKAHNLEYGKPLEARTGKNHGRFFTKCPKQCFMWLDEMKVGEKNQITSESMMENVSLSQLNVSHEQGLLRNADVSFMGACELSTSNSYMRERRKSKGRGFDDPFPSHSSSLVYLTITRKESSSSYSKDDIWILFVPGQPEKQALFRSTFHGPSKSLEVELTPLSRVPFVYGFNPIGVCAVRGPNFSSEFKELEILAGLSFERFPLLPFILQPKKGIFPNDGSVLSRDEQSFQDEPIEKMISDERLNDDQARVLHDIVRVGIDLHPDPPVTLVHGVFGSGKSTVLSSSLRVLDFLIDNLLDSDPAANSQILFAATTNAAVDRVLTDLFKRGFTSFLRVGSRKRIAKELFPFTLHCLASDDDDIAEMTDLLGKAQSPQEERCIKEEIEAVRAGQMKKRRELLSTVRVVGATCTACTFDVLAKRRFRLVVMDECSQTKEPTSLLAMANFYCERVVLVGDPQQLPPVITSAVHGCALDDGKPQGLAKTLFERLSHGEVQPIMLRTQYRCHPVISGLANRLFYEGKLLDGITAADRPPIIPGLPPVVFCRGDAGTERVDCSGSVYNEHEAQAAAAIVSMLVNDHEVAPNRIGVICLYRAQASCVRKLTDGDSSLSGVPVSTVDAFQGEERDVIILTVSRTTQLGFSDSPKRLNVAITRAKTHLIIIGHQGLLSKNPAWKALLQPALDAAPAGVQDCKSIIQTRSLSI